MTPKQEYWRNVWKQALTNTPYREKWNWYAHHDYELCQRGCARNYKCPCILGYSREQYQSGRLTMLGRLLGMKMHKEPGHKNYVHMHIRSNMSRGTKPKDPEIRRRLVLMGSPFGKYAGWEKTKKLGLDKKYKRPY